jgi:AhpD family alkylhydroperoxidase
MSTHIDYRNVFPEGVSAMVGLEKAVAGSTLDPALLELVRVRVSQLNGCGYCLAMHNRDARKRGEAQTRLDTVAAWRETPFFTAREQAALAWCEAVTLLAAEPIEDADRDAVRAEFDDAEVAALTVAIVAINGWNRLAVGLGSDVTTLEGLDAGVPG